MKAKAKKKSSPTARKTRDEDRKIKSASKRPFPQEMPTGMVMDGKPGPV